MEFMILSFPKIIARYGRNVRYLRYKLLSLNFLGNLEGLLTNPYSEFQMHKSLFTPWPLALLRVW
jgi:hypothetical protein